LTGSVLALKEEEDLPLTLG